MTDEPQRRPSRRPLIVTVALLGSLAAIWILGTAPSAGPDEPAHTIRGAALVRGQLAGQVFDLPAWIGHPSHNCFALIEEQPANCATLIPRPTGDAQLVSRSWEYPVWGHLAPGFGTLFPAAIGNQMARVFDAILPIGLIVASLALARRRGPEALAATALAVTPMAWFSIIVVNPSGLVIAGGLALWAGLLSSRSATADHDTPVDAATVDAATVDVVPAVQLDRLAAWTIAAGWAAAALPRRDGLIWAALIVGLCAAVGVVDLRVVVRRIGAGPLAVVAASTAATLVWAATSDTASARLLFLTPLVPLIGEGTRRLWNGPLLHDPRRRTVAAGGGIVLGGVLAFGAMLLRTGQFDDDLFQRIVAQTGQNLEEAVGVLGSLDTPLPRTALFLWLILLGLLAGVALARGDGRSVALAGVVVVIVVVAAWVLEMNQGNTSGTYWQGRYSLPLLIGAPVLLGWRVSADDGAPRDSSTSISTLVIGGALLVLTMAFAAGLRRWGVGTAGSLDPRDWDTYGTALPPWFLLLAHSVIAGALVVGVTANGWAKVATLTTHDAPDD